MKFATRTLPPLVFLDLCSTTISVCSLGIVSPPVSVLGGAAWKNACAVLEAYAEQMRTMGNARVVLQLQ